MSDTSATGSLSLPSAVPTFFFPSRASVALARSSHIVVLMNELYRCNCYVPLWGVKSGEGTITQSNVRSGPTENQRKYLVLFQLREWVQKMNYEFGVAPSRRMMVDRVQHLLPDSWPVDLQKRLLRPLATARGQLRYLAAFRNRFGCKLGKLRTSPPMSLQEKQSKAQAAAFFRCKHVFFLPHSFFYLKHAFFSPHVFFPHRG